LAGLLETQHSNVFGVSHFEHDRYPGDQPATRSVLDLRRVGSGAASLRRCDAPVDPNQLGFELLPLFVHCGSPSQSAGFVELQNSGRDRDACPQAGACSSARQARPE
jgi:hypothetical protein